MDGTHMLKEDVLLRQLMSHPESSDHHMRHSYGFATMRLSIAIIDAVQLVLVGWVSSYFLISLGLIQTAGLTALTAMLALMIRRGARSTTNFKPVTVGMVARRAALATVFACLSVLAMVAIIGGMAAVDRFAPWLAVWGLVAGSFSLMFRALPIRFLRRITKRAVQPTVAVVGPASSAQMMTTMLSGQGTHLVVAEIDPNETVEMHRLEQLASLGKVDKVVIVGCSETDVERVCFALSDTPTLVCLGFATTTTSSLMAASLHATQHPPFLPLLPSPMSDWRGLLKRSIDVMVVLVSVPLMAPVLLLAAAAIRLESPGPIFFRQWRFGLGSKPTQILKFRTMYHGRGDTTGEARTLARDPRVTFVGRWLRRTSIDELPQLLNVLRGEMSLVGPRPHATHMKVDGDYYFEAVRGYRIRHRVKPGITGWAQVTGSRGEVDTIEKALERVEKDLWYVRNWSLALDLRILVLTALGGFASPRAD